MCLVSVKPHYVIKPLHAENASVDASCEARYATVLTVGLVVAAGFFLCCSGAVGAEGRETISLNGTWQIEESVSATEAPKAFTHTVVVPGMVNLSNPPLPDVDLFASREYIDRFGRTYPGKGEILPASADLPVVGVSLQKRNYFWYRTSFTPPGRRAVALLKINKSQFGAAVWLNGKMVGEHPSCWTAGYFDLTDAIDWQGENELLVRIGAHPGVVPENMPAGTSASKQKWTPGIYDDVALLLCDNPVIESVQVAPRIDSSEVTVQTIVKNHGAACDFQLSHRVKTWKEGVAVAQSALQGVHLEAGEEKTVTETITIPNVRLWSPEDPFLYLVESSTGGDSLQTRFGMREVRFDGASNCMYLNGRPYYLRGGNIELSLYLEDPLCGNHPWDRQWVRKLVGEIPKRLNWNGFRYCVSAVPEFWLDIADEEGMLIQYEPTLWGYHQQWDTGAVVEEFSRWMRDNWNHPCVFIWDANNESKSPELVKVINAVRALDLSNRAWDNGWSPSAGANDPSEVHPYLLLGFDTIPALSPGWAMKPLDFRQLTDLNGVDNLCKIWNAPPNHPYIINEYCWLWLYSDGTPVDLTEGMYNTLVPNGSAQERIDCRWYLTGALTEMWRTQRCATAVFYYEYFGSYPAGRKSPGPYDFGVFSDVQNLQLQPEFEYYMTEAFKPLGVCINFWGDGKPNGTFRQRFPIQGGGQHRLSVTLINDDGEPVDGTLVISLETGPGKVVGSCSVPFHIAGVGREVCEAVLPIPEENGEYLLKAVATPNGTRHKGPTISRRKVSVESI